MTLPTDNVSCDPTAASQNYHFALERWDTHEQLGFILCDAQGTPSVEGIQEDPAPATTMQMNTGATSGYSDVVYPNTPISQSDWGGGRGQEDADKDATKYADSWGVDTTHGDIILGPLETVSKTFSDPAFGVDPDGHYAITGNNTPIATKYTTGAKTFKIKNLVFRVKNHTANHKLKVEVYSHHTDGHPNALIGTFNTVYLDYAGNDIDPDRIVITSISGIILAPNTSYWIVFTGLDLPTVDLATDLWGGAKIMKYENSAWSVAATDKEINIGLANGVDGVQHFFRYKGQQYTVTQPDDGSVAKIFMNGYRGVAAANTGHLEYLDTGGSDTVTETGLIVKITAGPGVGEIQNWRRVTSWVNGKIYVDMPWKIVHSATTEYVVLNSAKTWTEVTGHGLTAPATDVCVVDNIIYICQGDIANIRAVEMLNSSGWTVRNADAGSKAWKMRMIHNPDGKRKIWAVNSNRQGISGAVTVSAYNTALDFASGSGHSGTGTIAVGSSEYLITGIVPYGNPQQLYVLKEDSFGSIGGNDSTGWVYAEIPLSEMRNVASDVNGVAAVQSGVLLYFALMDGLEAFYDEKLNDMGPNKGIGLKKDLVYPTWGSRKGVISDLINFPGCIFIAIDGGDNGESTIFAYNGIGHHELYRGALGSRIRSLFIQVIPGDSVDRLWFSCGMDILFIPVTIDPKNQDGYQFTSEGDLVSSWIYDNKKDVVKFWDSITVFSEGLSSDCHISVAYKLDYDFNDWVWLGEVSTSPVQQIALSPHCVNQGRRFRYLINLFSTNSAATPRIKAVVVNAVERVPQTSALTITFLVEDDMLDLFDHVTMNASDRLAKIKEWADSRNTAVPLITHYVHPYFEGRRVFLNRPSVKLVEVSGDASITAQSGGTRTKNIRTVCRMTLDEKAGV